MSGGAGQGGTEPAGLDHARDALRVWVFERALPFWSEHGFRPRQRDGAWPAVEQLTLAGGRSDPGFTRMRVQARQLFVFSLAAEHGVAGAAERAEGLYRFITRHGRVGEGGWARRLQPDGGPLDPTADLYDMAFVLFAFAHHARASGDGAPLREADRTLGFIRDRMAHPAGGFRNALPDNGGWRLQNPHMHLLEAAQALVEAGAGARWAALADEIAVLFHRHLLDPDTGTLGENFDQDWRRAGGIDGESVEPGHQAEWIWLLDQQDALFGHPPAAGAIRALARVCDGQGVGAETGLMRDEIGRDGALRRGSSRLWPQCELLRAACVLHRRAETPGRAEAALPLLRRTLDNLLGRFLVGSAGGMMPPGTWIDQLDAFGRPDVRTIPTSSFYHLMTAWTGLDGFVPAAPARPDAASPPAR